MAYVDIPGAWVETMPARGRSEWSGTSPTVLNQTARVIDAANESIELSGRVRITGRATSVAFDTNSKIIFRTGTGNVFTQASSVIRIGLQDTDNTNGPPARGDGSWDVYGELPNGTYADIADSTTYSVAMTSGTKTLSHGDKITIKIEFVTFTASDTVRVQSFLNTAAVSGGMFMETTPNLNTALTTSAPCPLILDFEGDGTVLGIIDMAHIHVEVQDSIVTVASGNEDGMIVRPPVKCKVDKFYMLCRLTDGVNAELYHYTTPLGTPSGTLLATIDGDAISSAGATRLLEVPFAAIELAANTDTAFVLKSGGTSLFTYPMTFAAIAHAGHFGGFGVGDLRCTRTGGTGAFSTDALKQHIYGVHVCAWDDGTGGGGGGGPLIGGRLAR